QLSLFCKLWSSAQFLLFSSVFRLGPPFQSPLRFGPPFRSPLRLGFSVPVSALFGSSVYVSAPFGFSVKDSVKSGGSVHSPFSVAVSGIFLRSNLRLRLLSPFISPFRTVSFRKFIRSVYVPPFNLPLIFFRSLPVNPHPLPNTNIFIKSPTARNLRRSLTRKATMVAIYTAIHNYPNFEEKYCSFPSNYQLSTDRIKDCFFEKFLGSIYRNNNSTEILID
ncbi:hypothetical protein BpHYR1_022751, partial [Brachionus plicatilis]